MTSQINTIGEHLAANTVANIYSQLFSAGITFNSLSDMVAMTATATADIDNFVFDNADHAISGGENTHVGALVGWVAGLPVLDF